MARKSRSDSYEGRTQPLQELCHSITDCHHSTPKWTESGYLVIRNFNIRKGTLVLDDASYTDAQTFHERIARAKPEPGDLVISREAPMGQVAMIPEGVECCLGQRMVLIKPDPRKVNARYLLFAMQSEFVQKQIGVSDKTGSTVSNLRIPLLKELAIPVFDTDVESHIASVLSALDDKIALNTRINAELEAMAKLLYDYWFVQFDFPNAKGKPYKSSGGAMMYNAELKREVPEGWEVGTLLDIANYANGLACQRFRPTGEEHLRVIKIKEMGAGFTPDSEKTRPDIPAKALVENGDVLFSWSASLEVMIWAGGRGALNQHIFKVTSQKYPKSFFFHQLRNYLQHFKMMAENRKTTMGHITQEHLEQSRIVIPPLDLIKQLDEKIAPLMQLQVTNSVQCQELTTLRDWLLPMLMNGQVVVGEAAEQVGTPSPDAQATEGLAMAAEAAGAVYGKKRK